MAAKTIQGFREYYCEYTDTKPDHSAKFANSIGGRLYETQADGSVLKYFYTASGWAEEPLGEINFPPVSSSSLISPTGGSKTVTTAGTGVPLVAVSTKRTMLYVRAKTTNTQNIYFGDSTVDKTTSKQVILAPSQSVSIDAPSGYSIDVNQFYIDSEVNLEGVDFLYI